MTEKFEYVPEVERGEWLRPMEAEPFSSVLSIVPRGYEMYARVFHPVARDRPIATRTWHGIDQDTYFETVADIDTVLESEPTTWAQASTAFGTTMHPAAQHARLLRGEPGEVHSAIGHDGWRYMVPDEGNLEATSLAIIAGVLARHTTTPGVGIAAVWEGWGGLVSSSSSQLYEAVWNDEPPTDHDDESGSWRTVAGSLQRRLTTAIQLSGRAMRVIKRGLPTFTWNVQKRGSGVLPPEIATGPRFDLHGDTGRHYFLFKAGADDLADPGWPDLAPWVDDTEWAQSPSILWPDDRSWVLATEIYCDSTLIAGSQELIGELLRTPGLEVLPIQTNADLTWDGDTRNR